MKKNKSKRKILVISFAIIISTFILWRINRGDIEKFAPQDKARLLFVGDMFFDRHIRKVMTEKGGDYVFSCVNDFFGKFDTVIGNLEGPITDYNSVSLGSEVGSPQNFIFTFPSSTARLLKNNNVRIVSLGNNHIGNFGKEGIAQTKKYLDDSSISYFGGLDWDEPVLRKEIRGIPISFIAYNQFGGRSPSEVSKDVSTESQAGRKVIVFAHWGEEYTGATQSMKKSAKLFADSGASLVIGAHPHVILAQEKIGDTQVFYSLGNFIFDQYWTPEVSTGMGVEVIINDSMIETSVHRFDIKRNGQTCLSS